MLDSKKSTNMSVWLRWLLSKWFLIVLLVCALAALAWYLTHRDSASAKGDFAGFGGGRGGRNATTVGIATVEKADIPIVLNALGTVTATATATVRPQVSGVLQQVNFHEGQMVKAGQVLATIDPRQFELALLQSSGQLQRDQAQLENARQVLQRNLILQKQDSIAQQDVEAQATLVKQLEGTVMTDRALEGNARLNLGYTKVIAPISGRVGLRSVDVGNLVSSSDTAGIAVITQLAPIDVEFAIPQTQVADLQTQIISAASEQAPIKVSALDRTRAQLLAEGEFLALDNQVDVQTGTVRAKARFANADMRLFPNEFINVKLVMRTIKDALQVPISALRHGGNGDFVYVLNAEDHTVALRPVVVGQADDEKVQIASGVQLGEKVITEGADRLKDGAKVNLPGDHPADAAGGDKRKSWGNKDAKNGESAGSPPKDKEGTNAENGARDWKNKDGANRHKKTESEANSSASGEASSRSGERRHRQQPSE